MLTFVSSVIDKFDVGQNAVHVAFVRYSDQPSVIFNLNTYYNKSVIRSVVAEVQYVGGGSNLAVALDTVMTQVFIGSNVRDSAWKVVIVITDQLPAITVNDLETVINSAQRIGIRMYGVGIAYVSGRSIDSNSLYRLSFNADQTNPWQATWVYGYNDLTNKIDQLVGYACMASTIPTPIPSPAVSSVVSTSDLCTLLIQQHLNNSGSYFNRTWDEYKAGFGNTNGNFWLGNEQLYHLTKESKYKLRFDLQSLDNLQWYWAEYSTFVVYNESSGYAMYVGGFTGTVFYDSLSYHNGQKFSTRDRDNDQWTGGNCATRLGGGFWYKSCSLCSVNAFEADELFGWYSLDIMLDRKLLTSRMQLICL
jgi:hypothetical protein